MTTDFMSKVTTKKCMHCGYLGELNVPNAGLARYNSGALVQDAFPDLTAPEREQIVSGTHPECWEEMFCE